MNTPHTAPLPFLRTAAPRSARQRGQGAVEFLLAAVPVLLLGLACIEAAHWYFTRQAVSLALMQAGRVAITQHADPASLDQAFAQALLPLYAAPSPAISQARLERAMRRREQATALPAWRIRIVSPAQASFNDFSSSSPDLPTHGRAVIDNDYLDEQHQARLAQGWPEGRGPLSGQTTLEANTLILHLTWLHEPLLPGMKQLLRQVAPLDSRYGSQAMARAGYLPIQRTVALVMQSHAIAWDMPDHGRITRMAHPTALENNTVSSGIANEPAASCNGLWCLEDFKAGASAHHSTGSNSTENNLLPEPPDQITPQPDTPPGTEPGSGPTLADDEPYGDTPGEATDELLDDCPGCCD